MLTYECAHIIWEKTDNKINDTQQNNFCTLKKNFSDRNVFPHIYLFIVYGLFKATVITVNGKQ